MLESELQRKKELVARICVALKRRQEKMIKARSRFKHMARSLYWSVIWPSITSRYTYCFPEGEFCNNSQALGHTEISWRRHVVMCYTMSIMYLMLRFERRSPGRFAR